MQVQPYLFFDGSCEQALAFYRQALGAKVDVLMRYKESPEPPPPGCAPHDPEKVMYAAFRVGDSVVMASDSPPGSHKCLESSQCRVTYIGHAL